MKRIAVIILAALLAVSLISGCGSPAASSQPPEAASSAPSPSSVEAEPASTPEMVSTPESSVEDSEILLPLSEEPVTITLWSTTNPGAMQYYETYYDIPAWQESFERTNVYFESQLVAGNVGNEAFALMGGFRGLYRCDRQCQPILFHRCQRCVQ